MYDPIAVGVLLGVFVFIISEIMIKNTDEFEWDYIERRLKSKEVM